MTDQPIAAGAMLSAIFFLKTAVMRTVKTSKNVPMTSMRKPLATEVAGFKKFEARVNGGFVPLASPSLQMESNE